MLAILHCGLRSEGIGIILVKHPTPATTICRKCSVHSLQSSSCDGSQLYRKFFTSIRLDSENSL